MSLSPVNISIEPKKYQGVTRDFAEFCLEELERRRFSAEPFDEEIFLQAVQLVLEELVPSQTEGDHDH